MTSAHSATSNAQALKLTHKIGKIFRRESHVRGVRRLRRHLHPIRLEPLLKRIDPARLEQIRARHASCPRQVAKYADVPYWLKVNIERVQDLGLPLGPPRRILDIGCGGGFFLFVAKHLGHDVVGLDCPGYALYDDLVDLFGLERRLWETKAFEPLPDLASRFDLITAFSTGFNRRADKSLWGPNEWEFFLDDLRGHLNPKGQVFLALNPAETGRTYYTDELRDFFLKRGAEIERERVWFKKL